MKKEILLVSILTAMFCVSASADDRREYVGAQPGMHFGNPNIGYHPSYGPIYSRPDSHPVHVGVNNIYGGGNGDFVGVSGPRVYPGYRGDSPRRSIPRPVYVGPPASAYNYHSPWVGTPGVGPAWPEWYGHHARCDYGWNWNEVRSASCTAQNSFGRTFVAYGAVGTEWSLYGVQNLENQALEQCYSGSWDDSGCFLVGCHQNPY